MTRGRDLLLLDTNIVLNLIRGNEIARRVDERFQIRHRAERPLISIVSVGEALALAQTWRWAEKKRADLEQLMRELVVVDIHSREVLERYADFHAWTRSQGRTMSDNDLWIAATAAATGAHLVTTDADFDVLDPDRIRRTYISTEVR